MGRKMRDQHLWEALEDIFTLLNRWRENATTMTVMMQNEDEPLCFIIARDSRAEKLVMSVFIKGVEKFEQELETEETNAQRNNN